MSESPNGVPISEATAKDFMMVRAALVRRLGGADAALVWARIYYRCDSDSRVAHEVDGEMWWRASHADLAKETGLSEKQARTAIDALVTGGFVERAQHGGRVYSYRTVTYLPIWADTESADMGRSIRPDGQTHLPSGAVAPLIETSRQEDTPVVPKGDPIDDAFALVWDRWPSPRRGTTKKSGSAFRTALTVVGGLRNVQVILDAIDRDVAVWRTWPRSDVQFIPLLSTWLNQERWQPSAAALPRTSRETFAQQKQDNNLALLARYREGDGDAEIGSGRAGHLRAVDAGS